MTGRTHDLAAFTALNIAVATYGIPEISLATALVAFSANMIGGLTPDIDQPTTDFWDKMRGGNFLSRLISPLFGGHRFISHSILGIVLFGLGASWFLEILGSVLLVDMNIVWYAFMIGYVSHLLTDSITREGVPWFFPIPWKIGFPPFAFLRLKTGGLLEKSFIFPGLIVANGVIFYYNYHQYLAIFHSFK